MPTLPMFPLGTVLFPYADLPLHVFEPRYRLMTRRVLDGDREFGVVLIERGSEVGGGDTRCDVATVAQIVQMAELPDGRFALSTVGLRRVRIVEWLPDDPYPQADVEPLPEIAGVDDARARDSMLRALDGVLEAARRLDPRIQALPAIDADPTRAAYEVAALAPIGPFDAQRVLEAPDTGTRLALLADLLDDQAEDLRARRAFDE